MNRSFLLICLIAILVIASAAPAQRQANAYRPATAYRPHQRPRRQFGWGMPMGGFGGGMWGDSFGFSESESFNMWNNGYNMGWW
ncbi:hypothetical protein V3C99_013875 [Haemonchus contortus]